MRPDRERTRAQLRPRRAFGVAVLALAAGACRVENAVGTEAIVMTSSTPSASAPIAPAQPLSWRVVTRHPHDPAAFTQGLLWHDGKLYESTGQYGASDVRRVDLATGKVELRAALPQHLFGEGLALVGDRLVQLTWREGVARLWDVRTLAPIGEGSYAGEGWGLAVVDGRLLQSDGSDRLTWRDPDTLQAVGDVAVTDAGRSVGLLNELEPVDGAVWANVWMSDEVVRLDPTTGRVDARLDLTPLREEAAAAATSPVDVLNGMAWRPETRTLLVTGKLWPVLFELAIDEPGRQPPK